MSRALDLESRAFFIMKSCTECGNKFDAKGTSRTYCCSRCQKDAANRRKLAKYHANKKFPMVKCEACEKEFEKTWGNTRYCSEKCKSGKDGRFHVYILPEVNYAGMTNNIKERMRSHRRKKKIKDYKIVASYDCPKKAHLHETQLHVDGYDGFFVERSYS